MSRWHYAEIANGTAPCGWNYSNYTNSVAAGIASFGWSYNSNCVGGTVWNAQTWRTYPEQQDHFRLISYYGGMVGPVQWRCDVTGDPRTGAQEVPEQAQASARGGMLACLEVESSGATVSSTALRSVVWWTEPTASAEHILACMAREDQMAGGYCWVADTTGSLIEQDPRAAWGQWSLSR